MTSPSPPPTKLPLSVLDLCPVATDGAPRRSIHDSVELAVRAEELGYGRYWIAEHHNMPSIATSSPEVLVTHVAGKTKRIRVGAGGIMLPNHTPLKVVEMFRTLEALFPNRIDLGVGRAPGTDPVTSAALRRGRTDVNDLLAEFIAFAGQGFGGDHPFASIQAMPSDVPLPPIWMLGSTMEGARIAAALGVGYAFAGHFAMRHAAAAMRLYREQFQPRASNTEAEVLPPESACQPEPYAILALSVVCGEDDAHAEALARPGRIAFTRAVTGERAPLPTVEEARHIAIDPRHEAAAAEMLAGAVVGGPETVRDAILKAAREHQADEIMIASLVPDTKERLRSYERIARALAG